MADSKISALTDGGGLQPGDELAINRGGTSFKARGVGADGWIDDTAETWTYASGSGGGTATFTIAGVDLTTKYTVGTRIKLTQTTVKYFVVIAVSFSTNTTVTITAGSDFTLANAAISLNYHSYVENPQGYPGMFNFAHAATGFTGAVTTGVAKFSLVGHLCTVLIQFSGTSNATTCTFTLPVASVDGQPGVVALVSDAGTTGSGRVTLAAASTTATAGKVVTTGGGFTNSGAKAVTAVLTYAV